jgi:hypothetical protein
MATSPWSLIFDDGAGRMSVPARDLAHGSALRIARWWHSQHNTATDRTPLARMLPSVIGGPACDRGRALIPGEDTASAGRSERCRAAKGCWTGTLSLGAMARGGPAGKPKAPGLSERGSCTRPQKTVWTCATTQMDPTRSGRRQWPRWGLGKPPLFQSYGQPPRIVLSLWARDFFFDTFRRTMANVLDHIRRMRSSHLVGLGFALLALMAIYYFKDEAIHWYAYDRHAANVDISVSATNGQCETADHPLSISITNSSSRAIDRTTFSFVAKIPGHSTNIVNGYSSTDTIIPPRHVLTQCHALPRFFNSYDKRAEFRELEWSIEELQFTFGQ